MQTMYYSLHLPESEYGIIEFFERGAITYLRLPYPSLV